MTFKIVNRKCLFCDFITKDLTWKTLKKHIKTRHPAQALNLLFEIIDVIDSRAFGQSK